MTENRPRILYIEDDEGLAFLARRALTREGFEIVPAATLANGLSRFRDETVDAVVLDHYLPDGTGMDFLGQVGSWPEYVPIVYVTASSEARVAIDALTGGASDYVVKSVDDEFFPLLAAALRKAIDNARLKKDKEHADRLLVAAKERAELMLAEMNHRIANSLSLVSAMIRMQMQAVTEAETKAALAETQDRISAVAELHRSLYTSDDVAEVNLKTYLGSLITSLGNGGHRSQHAVVLHQALDQVIVSADKAVALGVIVTELVTNALKYAYPSGGGDVHITLQSLEGSCKLMVQDNGVGHDPSRKAQGSGLGTKLIKAMSANLGASVTHSAGEGGGSRILVEWLA